MITWGELRKKMKEAGVQDKDEIQYMDFSHTDDVHIFKQDGTWAVLRGEI